MSNALLFGKTIRLFLVEGNTNGLVTAELSNWTGKAFFVLPGSSQSSNK